ncbi:DUF7520 family protein [Halogeometricum luteum]|uniref:Cox cluster protein n=1 Tax=Halogeometricum luteum TaxID=2950537 RepID=A0ABU2G750_9EURY|nr:hypothetical protein [Halogeometricum sp. S3BR5-2]MDS0296622.1 hypothetical protein [Halogeometricum sp. S3BR5-2]
MEEIARTLSGKTVFGSVFAASIVIGAVFGLVLGTSTKIQHISVSDWITFHPTPTGMALYGATAAAVLVGAVLGIVLLLSRFDEDAI